MTTPRLFEIVPFTSVEELPLPDAGPYIVATKDGYFVHRYFHFGRVLSRTKDAPMSPSATPSLWPKFEPKLPATLIGQAYSFFRAIYESKKSEAMVDITWSPEKGYRLFVPPQQATGGGVKAERTMEHYRGQIVGTIHSHCNFNAFHSGTDTHDADSHDGLHITIGDVMKPKPSIAIMISVAKDRYNFDLEAVADGPLELHPHPQWWERYVNDPVKTYSWTKSTTTPTTTTYTPPKTGAIARIAPPSREHPMVIGSARYGTERGLALDELLWRYDGLFTAEEQEIIQEADTLIEQIQEALNGLGIDMKAEFFPAFPTHTASEDLPWDGARIPFDWSE